MFFDITPSWINHHYLSTNDTLWLSTVYEMTVVRQVGPYHVSSNVTKLFETYDDLGRLYIGDEELVRTPIVGYSLEDKTSMDWTLNFGKQRESYGNGKHSNNEEGVFIYHFSYDSCLDSIEKYDDDKYKKDRKLLVVVRHLLFYDNATEYHTYENQENDEIDSSITEDTLLVTGDNEKPGVFIVRRIGNQTPLTAHNTLD